MSRSRCDTPECPYWCETCGYCEHASHYHCGRCGGGPTGMYGHYTGGVYVAGKFHKFADDKYYFSCEPDYEEAVEKMKEQYGSEGQ